MVNSCRTCRHCNNGDQQYCKGGVFTYNTKLPDGRVTYGGYSTQMVCDEGFVFRFPDNLPLDKGAPLLCAGITVYNPMVVNGLDKPGTRVGVIGLGGAF
jgi:cinnamyl-alcohol dehydrogenase